MMNDIIDRDFKQLLDSRPGVRANSALIISVWIIAALLAILFFTMGLSMIINDYIPYFEFLSKDKFARLLFIGITWLGFIFMCIICLLCKMVMKRNRFIQDLHTWYENIIYDRYYSGTNKK